jgi:phosphohistidine phosphatase
MKYLLLVRHSAAEDGFGKADHDRELTPSGVAKVTELCQTLQQNQFKTDLIITSTATRTYHTATLIAEQIGYDITAIQSRKSLYNPSENFVWDNLHSLPNACQSVVVISHNPAISYIVETLSKIKQQIIMQPCGAYCFQFEFENWQQISKQTGTILWHFKPIW